VFVEAHIRIQPRHADIYARFAGNVIRIGFPETPFVENVFRQFYHIDVIMIAPGHGVSIGCSNLPGRQYGQTSAVLITAGCKIVEARVFPTECECHHPDRAVTLFADNDLGLALFRRVVVVDLIAINEQDQVGILLDRT
jgi:hypothetical protein